MNRILTYNRHFILQTLWDGPINKHGNFLLIPLAYTIHICINFELLWLILQLLPELSASVPRF